MINFSNYKLKNTDLAISVPLQGYAEENKLLKKLIKLSRKGNAFTLAETLITLTIIGVIAAITVPTLMTNYQKHTYVVGLKKANAELQNVFSLMRADQDLLYNSNGINSETRWDNFYEVMNKYMPVTRLDKNSQDYAKFPDRDGICIRNKRGIEMTGSNASNGFFVDINGKQRPNKLSRDIFRFQISDDNFLLIPSGSAHAPKHQYAGTLGYYWKDLADGDSHACNTKNVSSATWYGADTCAGRVLETGKMDY